MHPSNHEQFTEKAWAAIIRTSDLVKESQQQQIESEHLLLALLEKDGLAGEIFTKAGAGKQRVQARTTEFINRQAKLTNPSNPVYLGLSVDTLFDRAESFRHSFGDKYISIEHLVLGFIEDVRFGQVLLQELELTEQRLKQVIIDIRSSFKSTDKNLEAKQGSLERYGQDLTELAREGKLDLVIGRINETQRIIHILSRRTKNNPILIGEPGVGKSAIIHGLAQRIVAQEVPDSLRDSKIIALDVRTLVTDIQYEERLKSVLKEITGSDKQVILFVNDIHIVLESDTSHGREVVSLLRAMLMQEELRCIATTTSSNCLKLTDTALERDFEEIYVNQPTIQDTVAILRGLKGRYEDHHGIKISDNALVAAAILSTRYISDRFLPDKAIDLVDEAAAKLKIAITSKPEELDEIEQKILQLEIQRLNLEEKNDRSSLEHFEQLEQEVNNLQKVQKTLNVQWQSEKQTIDKVQHIKEEIDRINTEIRKAERQYDLIRATELKYGKLSTLQRELEESEVQLTKNSILREEVREADIAEIITMWTGIPVSTWSY